MHSHYLENDPKQRICSMQYSTVLFRDKLFSALWTSEEERVFCRDIFKVNYVLLFVKNSVISIPWTWLELEYDF